MLSTAARERGLSLMTFIDPALPRTLQGDPVRLRQVLLNLASNAIKFTEQGEVVIKVTVSREAEDEPRLHFQVKDTGIGCRMQRGSRSSNRSFKAMLHEQRYGGTGLGLSISKRFGGMMGGEIGVESVLGDGFNVLVCRTLARTKDRSRYFANQCQTYSSAAL